MRSVQLAEGNATRTWWRANRIRVGNVLCVGGLIAFLGPCLYFGLPTVPTVIAAVAFVWGGQILQHVPNWQVRDEDGSDA